MRSIDARVALEGLESVVVVTLAGLILRLEECVVVLRPEHASWLVHSE